MDGFKDPDHRLSRFIPIAENRLALNAIHRLLDRVGRHASLVGISPLFVHGPVGVGKSHLLHGLVNAMLEQDSLTRPLVISPDDLAGAAYSARGSPLDVLLIEDLHRVREHVLCEEGLIQWLDDCRSSERPVLVSSRSLPRSLGGLGSRALSRLLGGLVVHLPEPGIDSRVRLVLEFAAREQVPLTAELLQPLKDRLPASVRQLKALVSLVRQTPQGLSRLADCVDRLHGPEGASPQFQLNRLVQSVAGFFRVPARLLRSARRDQPLMLPRHVAMFLARRETRLPLKRIGQYFGGRDHTTVLHACCKIKRQSAADSGFAGLLSDLSSASSEIA